MPPGSFLFAYGSLAGAPGARPARLRDHRRTWGIAMDNTVTIPGYKAYLAADGSRPDVCVAFLDVEPAPGASVQGELLPVDRAGLRALDRRERNYDRVDVSGLVDGAPAGARVWTFAGLPAARDRLARARAAGRAVVHAAYARSVAGFEADTVPHDLPVVALERIELPPPTLERDGYVLVPDVAGPELLAPLVELARSAWGVDPDDPSTWRTAPAEDAPAVWGHQAQWDLRQHPGVHAAFARLLGRDELWVSQDGLGVRAPGDPGMPVHWDVDPRADFPHRVLGGLVYVTDTPLARGPFRAVPGLFRDLDGWFDRHPGTGSDPDDLWNIDVEHHASMAVPGCAGDLVVWDARLPHGNEAVAGSAPRLVQFLTMWPPGTWGETAADHQAIWRSRRPNPAYLHKPGWDRTEPWGPAALTPLGRRLIGLEPWGGDPRTRVPG